MGKIFKVLEDNCVGCKICFKNCPVDAIHMEDKKAIIDETCIGCGVCFKLCRFEAIEEIAPQEKIAVCNVCPIHCSIGEGLVGACHRYRNEDGVLERTEPINIVDPDLIKMDPTTKLPNLPLISAYGAGSNLYSADVPSKIVTSGVVDGVDVVTCATETVLSFNGARVKVDTDEFIGDNGTPVRREGVIVGYINTAEYGSQMIYIGGSHLNTGKDGHMVLRTTIDILNKKPVTLRTESVKELIIQHGKPPIIDGEQALRMRIGCGTVIASTFTLERWDKVVDEVITIDYDVTSKMSTHTTSGKRYGYKDSGITPVGTYSSEGRYFGIPGSGWGGSTVMEGRDAIKSIDKDKAWPGLRLLVTEPTAVRAVYFELDENLEPVEKPIPAAVEEVLDYVRDNCEPCNCHASVVAGFGGGIRDVISNTRTLNVNDALHAGKLKYTICGQPVYIMPGGGITAEAWVENMPEGAFTWVPTPAMVCPMEITMTKETYEEIGGYMDAIVPVDELNKTRKTKIIKP